MIHLVRFEPEFYSDSEHITNPSLRCVLHQRLIFIRSAAFHDGCPAGHNVFFVNFKTQCSHAEHHVFLITYYFFKIINFLACYNISPILL